MLQQGLFARCAVVVLWLSNFSARESPIAAVHDSWRENDFSGRRVDGNQAAVEQRVDIGSKKNSILHMICLRASVGYNVGCL